MRLAVLTSVETRHRYVVNRLCAVFDVVAVGYETTGYSPAAVEDHDLTPAERAIVAHHYAERAREEERFFAGSSGWLYDAIDRRVLRIAPGGLNHDVTLAVLEAARPDAVAVYGTNLIREPLLSRWSGRMVNLHLGLSPYYRGTAANFYPLLNEEPEYVGATIHLIDAGIDSGPILRHARPSIVRDDRPHTIGCKAILAGVDALIASLKQLEAGEVRGIPQWPVPNARVYFRRDYHPRQVVELYGKLEKGLIPRYAERVAGVMPRIRLVT
jgi:hypothetical protein